MKQKLFTFFFALVASVSAIYASDIKVDGIWYDFNESKKTATVTYRGSSYDDYWDDYSGTVVIPSSVTYNGTTYSVTSIGRNASFGCRSLTSVTIPNSVTSIGEYAFEDCSSLTSVTIPNSVTSIGSGAFRGCSKLTSPVYNAHCFAYMPTSYSGAYTIPEGIEKIAGSAFNGCSKLTSITIPESVTSIGDYAFQRCSSLTSITIPNSVTSIGDYAFRDCSSLTSVTIGESVTSIGYSAFRNCTSLTSITCEAVTPPTIGGTYTFDGVSKSIPVYVPCECVEAYKAASGWSDFTNIQVPLAEYSIEVYVNDTRMGTAKVNYNNFCEGNQISASPNIGYHFVQWSDGNTDTIRTLELTQDTILTAEFALSFSGQCGDSLYWELVDDTLHITGSGEMYNYNYNTIPWKLLERSIKVLTIAEDVTKLNQSFFICSVLESVVWNARHVADASIFYEIRSQITSFTFGEAVEYIPAYLCSGCSKLTSVTIPNSVTSIGGAAFEDCSSLTSVHITDLAAWCNIDFVNFRANPLHIAHNLYLNGELVKDLVIPNGVTSIGNYAFDGCSSVTSVTIPNSVTSIGNSAFDGRTSLTSITCEAENPPTVGSDAFYNVSKSIPVYVPCGCVGAYKAASGWSDFTNIQVPLAEYSIEVDVNDTIMGSAKVDINNACGAQISATPNFGYHFVQWSDRNTDNPRTLELTQNTTLTAEFALNQYTVTTLASHNERGTTQGDTTVNYLDSVTITANSNYGYHFVQWNDGNSDNPRQVQVTGNTTYTATFDKNTYAISLSCNEEQGSVEGVTSAEYLDTVTISATPNIGYHFVQWSDGNTDTIRTLVLTQDTTLTAEFAQSFSGQCGDSLYWELVDTTLHITGKGEMYNYKSDSAPWKLLVSSIKVLTIAEDVTKLGQSFDSCSVLESIVWNAKHAADAYSDGQYVYPIFYGIRSQITSFTFGEAVEYIPTYLCVGMDKLTSMIIPNSVTSIGNGAFYDCSSLTSVTIPNSVTSIGYYAFRNCTSLTSITIPESVTSIENWAFEGCSSLTSMTIPESVTSIGGSAFSGCSSLTSVTVGESVTSIGDSAFEGCSAIDSIVWNAKNCADASSLETAPFYAIRSQITSFTFGENVEHISAYLCDGMEKLTSVTIPNSVKTIGASAFDGCARLGKITLGTGLEEIAANAFAGCTRLYDIYCHAVYPPFVDESSFANYNAYLYIPCDSKRDYTLDPVWGKFQHIECLSNEETDVENVDTSSQQQTNCQKIIRNGQLLILRDGKTYNAMGQEL